MLFSVLSIKKAAIRLAFCSLVFALASNCYAQEKEPAFSPHHQLALVISHAHIFEGRDEENKRKVLTMPSWGIDYTYYFKQKWGIGLHTDIIIEKYKVEKRADNETIERSYPIAPALVGIFKPTEHWSFLLGMGAEISKEETFTLTRAGIEYSSEIRKGWEVFGSFSYDMKWNAYDTWGIGIGIAKKFGKSKHEKS